MNAVIVSVEYTDLLTLTLPYNRAHFNEVLVVTSIADKPNVIPVAIKSRAEVYATNAFYEDGAAFNKYKAVEEGLDVLGRSGWIAVIDADIAWPKDLAWSEAGEWLEHDYPASKLTTRDFNDPTYRAAHQGIKVGHLSTPRRRLCEVIPDTIPPEADWVGFPLDPLHKSLPTHFSGYTHIFNAKDPALPDRPWYQTDWRHAGGADTFFQAMWPVRKKVRPKFEVLHIGPRKTNWCGRVDGVPGGDLRAETFRDFMKGRSGKPVGGKPYGRERL